MTQIVKGTINHTEYVFIQDSSSSTGAGLTGLVYNSAGLTCYYTRPLAAAAALTLATQTVTGAHSDGGFVEVDATNQPGIYRLDYSDAILAAGVDSVVVHLKGATNMAPVTTRIQLTDVDLNDGVRAGLTALPNAAADAAGGLPISDAGGLDLDAKIGGLTFTTANKIDARIDNIAGQTVTAASAVTVNAELGASATAMDAFEDQYDGTGLVGDTYPATQSQLSGLVIASAALSIPVVDAPNGFVLTTGIEVNDEDATQALDGTRHQLSDSAGVIDGYYIFNLGPFGKPVSATFESVVNGGNDTFTIYANIGSSGIPNWSPRKTVTGTGSTSNVSINIPLFESDVLTDDSTAVWLRVSGTGLTTANFNTDFLYLSRSILPQFSGYDNGAVWVDTTSGTAGTVIGYNGIASRSADTFADALTIANSPFLGLHRFEFSNDSSITLPSATTNKILTGRGWELNMNGQDITNIHVIDAEVTGVGAGSAVQFHDSSLDNVTCPTGSFHNCSITGTFTCSSAGVYHFHQSHSGDTSTPIIDLGAAVGATTLLMHNWKGAVAIDNLGATGADIIHLAGDGEVTLNASCTGGTLNIQGNWRFTNNGSGVTINYDDNTSNIAAILTDTADIQPKIGTPVTDISTDIATVDSNVDAILLDTGTTIPAQISALNDPTAAAIAAAVYSYNMGNGRTIGEALAFLRNKWTLIAGVLTVYDTDDTTVLWTSTVTQTAGDPVSASDPA